MGCRHRRHQSRAVPAVVGGVGRHRAGDIAKSDCGCGDRLSSISPALSDTLETKFKVLQDHKNYHPKNLLKKKFEVRKIIFK